MKELLLLLIIISVTFSDRLTLSVERGEFYVNSYKAGLFKVKSFPQKAIWLEESDGSYIRTLFVTQATGKALFKRADDGVRPSSLPIWMFKRGIKNSDGGYWPTTEKPVPDAITGATPEKDFSKSFQLENDEVKRGVLLRFEINNSMDFNDSYHENVGDGSEFYSNGVNGQPSVIYQLEISEKLYGGYGGDFELHFEGSGSASGTHGVVDWEAPDITTAENIVDRVTGILEK